MTRSYLCYTRSAMQDFERAMTEIKWDFFCEIQKNIQDWSNFTAPVIPVLKKNLRVKI